MNNENFELEDMREQMSTLKKKLNQQEIVNDRLVRRSMKNEVNTITRRYTIVMILSVLTVPFLDRFEHFYANLRWSHFLQHPQD